MIVKKNYDKTLVYMDFALCAIGKNVRTGNHLYYIRSYKAIQRTIMIYKGKSKPFLLNRYTLTLMALLVNSVGMILLAIIYPVISYINGAKNFITDSFCCNDVRFFSYVNFIGLMGILGYLYFR